MSNVKAAEQLLKIAQRLGYEVRFDNLIETQGGVCELGHRKLLVLDLNQNAEDHLEILQTVIESERKRLAKKLQPGTTRKAA